MSEGKWVPPPPPRRRLPAPKIYVLVILVLLVIGGLIAFPYLPPVPAEREHAVAVARAELDQLALPMGTITGGAYSTIDLGRGPRITRQYASALSCQETHDYYARTVMDAGWSVWKPPYSPYKSDLLATYRKQTQGITLKLILDCSLNDGNFGVYIIEPDWWNQEDQPAPA